MTTDRFDSYRHDLDPAVDPDLERAIRELDPADADLSAAQLARKEELLDSILASDPTESPAHAHAGASVAPVLASGGMGPGGPTGPNASQRPGGRGDASRPGSRARRRVRWLAPAAAAAVLTGALVITNSLGGDQSAYATWTQTPQPLTGDTLERAENACLDELARSAEPMPGVPDDIQPAVDLDSARTVLAEQRGAYLYLSVATDDGSDVSCFFDAANPDRATSVTGGTATVSSPAPPTLAPDEVEILGPGMMSGPEGSFAHLNGRVGADVEKVTLHSEGQTIEATVANGHVGAWWPIEFDPATVQSPGTVLDPIITVDVTLADGTVRTDVPTGMSVTLPGPSEIGPIMVGGGVGPDGGTSTVAGYVGEDVVGVTVVTADGQRIEADVADGQFAAEWPDEIDSSGAPVEAAFPTFDLTLTDGTVLTGQEPASSYGEGARD